MLHGYKVANVIHVLYPKIEIKVELYMFKVLGMVEREPKKQKTSSFDIFKGWSSLQFVQNEKTQRSYNKSKQLNSFVMQLQVGSIVGLNFFLLMDMLLKNYT